MKINNPNDIQFPIEIKSIKQEEYYVNKLNNLGWKLFKKNPYHIKFPKSISCLMRYPKIYIIY